MTNIQQRGIQRRAPTVSVIMSCYRESIDEACEAIESILNQTYKDFEFIIILDGPDTGLINLLDEYTNKDSRIQVIVLPQQCGLAIGRNTAIDHARGQYIAMMDADDIADAKRIEHQVLWITSQGCDLVFTHMEYISESGSSIGSFEPAHDSKNTLKELLMRQPFGHPTALIRANIFQEERYDPSFIKGQDVDLWIRLAQKGFRFSILPEKLLRCRLHRAASFHDRLNRQRGYARYGVMIARKHAKSLWYLPAFWFFATKRFCYASILALPESLLIALMKIRDTRRA